jgi:ribosomal protein S18 acetylase RimI-like enzyme
VDAAADVLTRAFVADPGLLFVFPDPTERARLVPSLARAAVRYTLRCGAPLVTQGAVRGVALWFPPDAPELTGDELARTGIAQIPGQIGPAAWQRLHLLMHHLDTRHPHVMPAPHWYLALLGVDPIAQRRGIGERLMREVFMQADRDGLACYLEAPSAANARYYERRGFRVVLESDIPECAVHVWHMRRDPVA